MGRALSARMNNRVLDNVMHALKEIGLHGIEYWRPRNIGMAEMPCF
jgi:hypothetical protein